MSYNRLIEIKQTALNGLSRLENFDLTSNQIERIECRFLLNCRKLVLKKNKLKTIKNICLCENSRLEVLDLKENLITELNGKIFMSFPNLKELNLIDNPIKVIDRKVFFYFKRKSVLKLFNRNIFPEKIKHNNEIYF